MIQIIAGGKGSGKTKKMINMANEDAKVIKGHMVYIDYSNKHMYDLDHDIRFIDMEEYPVNTPNEFFGFLCGMISNDYDVEKMYIDGLFKFASFELEDLAAFVKRLDELSSKFEFNVVLTASEEEDKLPQGVKEYLVK